MKGGFKGNKQALPSKPCQTCGRPMSWRKAWAKNWEQVRYCSDACRAGKQTHKPARQHAGKHPVRPAAEPAGRRDG